MLCPPAYDVNTTVAILYNSEHIGSPLPAWRDRNLTISKCSKSTSPTNSQSVVYTAFALYRKHANSTDNYCFESSRCPTFYETTTSPAASYIYCFIEFAEPESIFYYYLIG